MFERRWDSKQVNEAMHMVTARYNGLQDVCYCSGVRFGGYNRRLWKMSVLHSAASWEKAIFVLSVDRKSILKNNHISNVQCHKMHLVIEIPVYERGLVLVIWRAFIACCCFSRAANMSPRSNWTGVLLFFPAAFDKASCRMNITCW